MSFITKILIFILVLPSATFAQDFSSQFEDDGLSTDGNIFQDFNEDLEAAQVMEDERFYRYARFFSVMLGLGFTTFNDNRGLAYEDNHPSFNFGLLYFMDFQNAFVMGMAYSKHTMFIDTFVQGSPTQIIGAVETSMLRPYMGFRYYIDTTDLGTAITYSNPYFVGRVEYWYQTNSFPERDGFSDQEGGGLGVGIGAGLEFPIELKETYFNIEFLYHKVNYFDKFTQDYRQLTEEQEDEDQGIISKYGYEDLRGDAFDIMMNYVISW
ncbi:MAG: hypothetical protein CME62_03450 [Halobacteriovoraceae bacterium]|nr:hypothetical protein [Halobacteriovoraceae bacterium]|tara:strand:- start:41296 stop:42096 length:801 start_codon:yes stop_codon:yes gene_type:complete